TFVSLRCVERSAAVANRKGKLTPCMALVKRDRIAQQLRVSCRLTYGEFDLHRVECRDPVVLGICGLGAVIALVLLVLVDIRQAFQEDHGLLLAETGQFERVTIPCLADLGRANGIESDVLEPRAGAEHLLEAPHHRLADDRCGRLDVRLGALEDDLVMHSGDQPGRQAGAAQAVIGQRQRRIVAKIDSLSGKSKRASEQLDHVPHLAEKYKLALLRAAFGGQLTAEWREKAQRGPSFEAAEDLVTRTAPPAQSRGGREATTNVRPGAAAI